MSKDFMTSPIEKIRTMRVLPLRKGIKAEKFSERGGIIVLLCAKGIIRSDWFHAKNRTCTIRGHDHHSVKFVKALKDVGFITREEYSKHYLWASDERVKEENKYDLDCARRTAEKFGYELKKKD